MANIFPDAFLAGSGAGILPFNDRWAPVAQNSVSDFWGGWPGLTNYPDMQQGGQPVQTAAMGYAPRIPQAADIGPAAAPATMTSGPLAQSGGGGGLLGALGNLISNNPATLMALGGGIAQGGIGGGLTAAAPVAAAERQQRLAQANQLATYQALRSRGLSHSDALGAIANPELLKSIMPLVVPQYEQFKSGETYGQFNKTTGQSDLQGVVPKFEKLGPGDQGVFVTPPFPGAGPTSVPAASGGPEKPPEGYQWADKSDQSKGLVPITGGPATKLPEGAAGHLAMMESSRAGVEAAKKYFLSPDFKSGPADAAGLAIGQRLDVGNISRHRRAVELGTEAALRMSTGAAAPEPEVKRYANFYLPSVYDAKETRQQKLDALTRFMDYAKKNIGQGRVPEPEFFMSSSGGSAAKPSTADPLGIR